jgi:hypothetical protein
LGSTLGVGSLANDSEGRGCNEHDFTHLKSPR